VLGFIIEHDITKQPFQTRNVGLSNDTPSKRVRGVLYTRTKCTGIDVIRVTFIGSYRQTALGSIIIIPIFDAVIRNVVWFSGAVITKHWAIVLTTFAFHYYEVYN